MKLKNLFLWLVPGLLITLTAQAHDIEEHMANGEKPNCAALENVDTAKMDKNDPVMQAMMKKCMEQIHQADHMHEEGGHMAQHMGDEHHAGAMHEHDEHGEESEHHEHH